MKYVPLINTRTFELKQMNSRMLDFGEGMDQDTLYVHDSACQLYTHALSCMHVCKLNIRFIEQSRCQSMKQPRRKQKFVPYPCLTLDRFSIHSRTSIKLLLDQTLTNPSNILGYNILESPSYHVVSSLALLLRHQNHYFSAVCLLYTSPSPRDQA
eukprot:TRINITY_DN7199_c0_g1_i5.p2 TRINITY_DN7199_c0_g1~~TRINITY_DN7199_c0_g1_i5.p2  ORF type:complete len:155 (+),score=0.22 TRINITY_DN7199_c0_g1_i5:1489-1953(+)